MTNTTDRPATPRWPLPRGLIVLLAIAAMVVVVAGLRAFADILGPVFLALMLAVLLFMRLDAAGFPSRLRAIAQVRPDVATAFKSPENRQRNAHPPELTLLSKALLLDIEPHTRWMNTLVTMGAPTR